jgi:hypothetical protein
MEDSLSGLFRLFEPRIFARLWVRLWPILNWWIFKGRLDFVRIDTAIA